MKKKDEGFVQYILALIVILVIVLIIAYEISIKKIQVQKQEIEDGITMSALASAVIDLNEFGTYKYIRSNNGRGLGVTANAQNVWGAAEDNLLNIFREKLAENLNLNPYTMEANEGSIIDGSVVITHFWIYNKELLNVVDEEGEPVMIKDYKGRWIRQHEETDRFYIYKYDATETGGFNKTTELAIREADGKFYTPYDDKVITMDLETGGVGTDGAGGGHVEVDSMTIYATVEFYVKPFGYDMNGTWGIWDGSKYKPNPDTWSYDLVHGSSMEDINKIKITKSVVVDVRPSVSSP